MNNSQIPIARKNGLVIQETGDEVLVYDLDSNQAHCLNQTAAFVWKSCDGRNSVKNIAELLAREFSQKVNEDYVWLAIDQLTKESLLENELKSANSELSRRQVIKKIGFGAALALPVVAMLSFPGQALAVTCAASYCGSNNPSNGCGAGDYCCKNPGNQYICQTGPCANPC